MRLPKWLQPIKDQTLRAARQVLQQPPRAPTLEEFTSPLREECKDIVKVKGDIGYNPHCTNCGRQRGFDEKLLECVENAEDPQPWLQQLHGELISTRHEMAITRQRIDQAKTYYTPMNRLKWAAYGAVGTGTVSLFMLAVRYVSEWALLTLPWIVHLFL